MKIDVIVMDTVVYELTINDDAVTVELINNLPSIPNEKCNNTVLHAKIRSSNEELFTIPELGIKLNTSLRNVDLDKHYTQSSLVLNSSPLSLHEYSDDRSSTLAANLMYVGAPTESNLLQIRLSIQPGNRCCWIEKSVLTYYYFPQLGNIFKTFDEVMELCPKTIREQHNDYINFINQYGIPYT